MQLNEFIDRLFERAQAAGFSDYEAYYSDGDEFEVTVFQGEIAGYTVSSSMGLNFRGMYQGNMGYASTQVLDEQALDMLVESARQNALIIEDTDQQFIFPGSERYPDLPESQDCRNQRTAKDRMGAGAGEGRAFPGRAGKTGSKLRVGHGFRNRAH